MANITTFIAGTSGTTGHSTRVAAAVPYLMDVTIDYAKALAEKGTALAASDTIEALSIPAGTITLYAGVQCIVPDNATTLTLDLGYTGGTVDHWVDGFDHAAAAANAYSGTIAGDGVVGPSATATKISLLFATLTGTLSVGKTRVWAWVVDASPVGSGMGAGLAQLKS